MELWGTGWNVPGDCYLQRRRRRCCGLAGGAATKLLSCCLVPKKGLEPPHPCGYMDLNHARLPIPPLRLGKRCAAMNARLEEKLANRGSRAALILSLLREFSVNVPVSTRQFGRFWFALAVSRRTLNCRELNAIAAVPLSSPHCQKTARFSLPERFHPDRKPRTPQFEDLLLTPRKKAQRAARAESADHHWVGAKGRLVAARRPRISGLSEVAHSSLGQPE